MEGGVSEYPSLPTVLSGNVSNAAVSVNEVKRMDRCPCSSPPHLSGPIQSPHPIVLVQLLRFGAGALLCTQHPAPGRRSSAENKDAANSFPLPDERPFQFLLPFPSLGVFAALSPAGSKRLQDSGH